MLAQYLFAMSRTGFMPAALKKVSNKYQSPYKAVFVTTFTIALFIVLITVLKWDPFNQVFSWLVGMGTLNLLILSSLDLLKNEEIIMDAGRKVVVK